MEKRNKKRKKRKWGKSHKNEKKNPDIRGYDSRFIQSGSYKKENPKMKAFYKVELLF